MDDLSHFLQRQNYPPAARTALLKAAQQLYGCPAFCAVLERELAAYRAGALNYPGANEAVSAAAAQAGVHPYTALLLFYILLCEPLKELYAQRGIPQAIFDNTVLDLRCKAQECFDVHGVWGTFVAFWNEGFFTCRRFGLGRLQYELAPLPCAGQIGAQHFPAGTGAINIHIPSSGPLRREDCEQSFAQAKRFFNRSPALFMCNSWLLYPANRLFLPAHSNILMFMDLFEIISQQNYTEFRDAWRIFHRPAAAPYDDLPQDTSLQRAFAAWLRGGGTVGSGLGILVR